MSGEYADVGFMGEFQDDPVIREIERALDDGEFDDDEELLAEDLDGDGEGDGEGDIEDVGDPDETGSEDWISDPVRAYLVQMGRIRC